MKFTTLLFATIATLTIATPTAGPEANAIANNAIVERDCQECKDIYDKCRNVSFTSPHLHSSFSLKLPTVMALLVRPRWLPDLVPSRDLPELPAVPQQVCVQVRVESSNIGDEWRSEHG